MAKTKTRTTSTQADRPNRLLHTNPGDHWAEMASKPGWQAFLQYGANRKQRRSRIAA